MSEQFAKPGEVGLIYTDENGNYHLLGLKPEQHQLLQSFVKSMTREQPAVQVEKYEIIIRERK